MVMNLQEKWGRDRWIILKRITAKHTVDITVLNDSG